MTNASLQQAHEAFYRALGEIFRGHTASMADLWSRADNVTYTSPLGDLLVGWPAIEGSWAEQAATITGDPMRPADNRFVESDGLGVVVGFERGDWKMIGPPHRSPLRLHGGRVFDIGGGVICRADPVEGTTGLLSS
jgi:hypothetical protein